VLPARASSSSAVANALACAAIGGLGHIGRAPPFIERFRCG
jgi:hypothetical protein